MSLKNVFQCPYCPARGGAGLLVVDADAVLAAAWPSQRPAYLNLYTAVDSPALVIFNPDGVPSRPCVHLISMILDVDILRPGEDGRVERRAALVACWDHPWFAANDPHGRLNEYVWTELGGGVVGRTGPTTPFEICLVERPMAEPGCPRRAIAGGSLIVAQQPEIFLEEIRVAEEWSRDNAGERQ